MVQGSPEHQREQSRKHRTAQPCDRAARLCTRGKNQALPAEEAHDRAWRCAWTHSHAIRTAVRGGTGSRASRDGCANAMPRAVL